MHYEGTCQAVLLSARLGVPDCWHTWAKEGLLWVSYVKWQWGGAHSVQGAAISPRVSLRPAEAHPPTQLPIPLTLTCAVGSPLLCACGNMQ